MDLHVRDRLGLLSMFQLFVARGGFVERKSLRGLLVDAIIFSLTVLFTLVIYQAVVWVLLNWSSISVFAHQYAQMGFVLGLVFVVTLVVCGIATTGVTRAAAGINQQLSFEGKIVDSGGQNIPDGTYNMEFKIYQDGNSSGSGSTLKWTEDHLIGGTGGVTFTSGTFQVNLGAVNPFGASVDWNQDTLWLSLQVGNTSSCSISTNFHTDCSGDGEMTPFIRLTATPYAMNADKLDGIDSSGFVQLNATQSGNINIGSGTVTSGAINGISIGSTVQPSSAGGLTVQANGANALTLTGGAASTWSTTSGLLTVQGGGGVTVASANGTTSSAIQVHSGNASAGAAGNVTIDTGTFTSGTPTVNIGNANAAAITIGNTTSATATLVQGGATGGVSVQTGSGGTVSISTTAQNGTVTIGTTATNTGNTQTINVGDLNAAGTTNVNVGTGASATAGTTTVLGKTAVTITAGGASTWSTSSGLLTVQGATGVNVASTAGTTSSAVSLQSGNASAGASGNATLDTGSFTSGTPTVNVGHTNAAAINVGNTTAATATLIQGGGTGGVGIQTGSGGTVSIGTTAQNGTVTIGTTATNTGNTQTINVGDLNAAGTTNVNIGTGASATAGTTTVLGKTAVTITAGGASTWSTTAGALTLTSAAASTWSTSAGNLTLQAGSGTVSFGSSTALTATAGIALSSGGANALALDTGGGAAINVGGTNATSIVLGGNTSATITEKVANSSATAYTLQTAGGTSLLVANTTSSILYVGGSATATTPILLVFGQKTATGDPAGVNGAEYYNSANNKFRCEQGGIWSDCISGFNTLTKTADQPSTVNTTTMEADNTLFFAMNANTTYVINAWIPIDDSNTGADEQYTFVTPAGAALNLATLRSSVVAGTANITCNIIASAQACQDTGTTVNSAIDYIQVQGFVRNGATAGNLQFEFAQRVSTNAAFPVIKKGATLTWHQSN